MAKKKSLLQKMKDNPKGDWVISDVEKLCAEVGLTISAPSSGSHYTIHSSVIHGIQTVPARRPIKPIYIHSLVGLCEAHLMKTSEEDEGR